MTYLPHCYSWFSPRPLIMPHSSSQQTSLCEELLRVQREKNGPSLDKSIDFAKVHQVIKAQTFIILAREGEIKWNTGRIYFPIPTSVVNSFRAILNIARRLYYSLPRILQCLLTKRPQTFLINNVLAGKKSILSFFFPLLLAVPSLRSMVFNSSNKASLSEAVTLTLPPWVQKHQDTVILLRINGHRDNTLLHIYSTGLCWSFCPEA